MIKPRFDIWLALGLVLPVERAEAHVRVSPATVERGVVMPLLAFNLGVELGQLGIVLAVLPVFYAAVRIAGPEGYRRRVLPVATFVTGGLALVWLVERSLEVTILGI